MHDAQYRCGVAWQNNCYNQPCYPSFYYAGDMDFANVLPQLNAKPTLWMAGDSIMQSYAPEDKPVTGWGEMLHTLAQGMRYAALPTARTAPSRRRCATSCRALSLTTAPWRAAAARPSARKGGWTTLPRISAPVICWWSASATTTPTAQRPSAMSRRMPSARACAPSGTLPAVTVRCASLPPRGDARV